MYTTNGVMMQFFHWYVKPDGSLWNELAEKASDLAEKGITAMWLPPAYKGIRGDSDVGYGVYDRYDLGEFDQQGSVRTKYGTKSEYINAIKQAKAAGMDVYADIVLNHMMGADGEETVNATPYSPEDRRQQIGEEREITTWTHFTFPGRDGKYDNMEWRWYHFNATDYDSNDPETEAVFLFENKVFENQVDLEKGSFDYLMGCNLDLQNLEVTDAIKRWGEWYVDTIDMDGFRFDAVKHVRAGFFPQWMQHVQRYSGRSLFSVGEYWSHRLSSLHRFIDLTSSMVPLFDAPLHYNFFHASREGDSYDMRTIFNNSLVDSRPELAVTIVDNHDSQPLQSLESWVESWFKPLAYALILLRKDGYPCIFYGDYYGATYSDEGDDGEEHEIFLDSHQYLIDKFLHTRHTYAHGYQKDYFDHEDVIGWTRMGDDKHPGGVAVVMSNGDAGVKHMDVGYRNCVYVDITGHVDKVVTTNERGCGDFRCNGGSVSVWVPQEDS
ncbi:MAG: alpha-amylase [Cyanobacteria bacterium P01_D01_bin.36]